MLLVSVVLGVLPLLGIAWILMVESIFTVDGLFMAIILLSISGVFFLNALLEARELGLLPFLKASGAAPGGAAVARAPVAAPTAGSAEGAVTEMGDVVSVDFFEAPVGQQNKSIVIFNSNGATRTLVFCGNVGFQLAAGRRVEISYRPGDGCLQLLGARQVATLPWFGRRILRARAT